MNITYFCNRYFFLINSFFYKGIKLNNVKAFSLVIYCVQSQPLYQFPLKGVMDMILWAVRGSKNSQDPRKKTFIRHFRLKALTQYY